jgi:hypothetical protein
MALERFLQVTVMVQDITLLWAFQQVFGVLLEIV